MARARKDEKVDNYNAYFPKLLRQLMADHNVKQEDLAKYVKVSRQAIGQYKDGNTTPDIYTFQEIVKYFREIKRVDYPYEYWLGSLNINSETGLNLENLGLSHTAFCNLLSFQNMPEKEAINLLLENVELIQLLQDYLGDEIRNKEHFAFKGTEETLKHMNNFVNQLDFNIPLEELYKEIKSKEIIKQLDTIKNKEKK